MAVNSAVVHCALTVHLNIFHQHHSDVFNMDLLCNTRSGLCYAIDYVIPLKYKYENLLNTGFYDSIDYNELQANAGKASRTG